MAFDDVRLNPAIERGAEGGPGFKTIVIGLSSGKEQRISEWLYERGEWDISYGIQDKSDFTQITNFFRSRRGKFRGFRFKDWADYEAVGELLGTGDGLKREFKLVKDYGYYKKRITRPVSDTVTVTINGIQKIGGFTVNHQTGIITFTNHEDHIPAEDAVVRASFQFDLPVRFDIDKLDLRIVWERAGSFPSIAIIELLEDEEAVV